MKEKILLSWSGGKDSALALRAILSDGTYDIASLLTTVTEGYDRISMHGVRLWLLERQAASLGLPVDIIRIPHDSTGEEYARIMGDAMARWHGEGVRSVAFGDIHLRDVRNYREEKLSGAGIQALFPIWGRDPRLLAGEFVSSGFRAIVTCVDTEALHGSFSGRELDGAFLADLPERADPCGENGEYHSFVYEGPVFARKVSFRRGETVLREGRFMYTDLLPA